MQIALELPFDLQDALKHRSPWGVRSFQLQMASVWRQMAAIIDQTVDMLLL